MKCLILAVIVSVAFAAPPKPAFPKPTTKPVIYSTVPPKPVYKEPEPYYVKAMLEPVKLTPTKYEKLAEVPIVRSESNIEKDGFNYIYETGNGIYSQASGTLKNVDGVETLGVQGQFQYPGDDDKPLVIVYTADENGYQPRGDFLPTPPPTPDYVYRLLKYLEEHVHSA